jgi:hypothetical protein
MMFAPGSKGFTGNTALRKDCFCPKGRLALSAYDVPTGPEIRRLRQRKIPEIIVG